MVSAPVRTSGLIALRQPGKERPRVLAIGSSTGGPQALFKFFDKLDISLKLPILLTQHMPPTFTATLAEHITRVTKWTCVEAKNDMPIEPGRIHIAQGGFHMVVSGKPNDAIIRLNDGPTESFCKPAVDPMLRSIVDAYGGRVLMVMLTGMGQDGLKGSQEVVKAGGTVIAQDEASSIVWGMPGAVATAGLCAAVEPLDTLPDSVLKFANRGVA